MHILQCTDGNVVRGCSQDFLKLVVARAGSVLGIFLLPSVLPQAASSSVKINANAISDPASLICEQMLVSSSKEKSYLIDFLLRIIWSTWTPS